MERVKKNVCLPADGSDRLNIARVPNWDSRCNQGVSTHDPVKEQQQRVVSGLPTMRPELLFLGADPAGVSAWLCNAMESRQHVQQRVSSAIVSSFEFGHSTTAPRIRSLSWRIVSGNAVSVLHVPGLTHAITPSSASSSSSASRPIRKLYRLCFATVMSS